MLLQPALGAVAARLVAVDAGERALGGVAVGIDGADITLLDRQQRLGLAPGPA